MTLIRQKPTTTFASTEQILDIQYSIGLALRKMPQSQATRLLKDKNGLQKLIRRICKEFQIPIQNERVIAIIPILEEYFKKVYGLDMPEIAEMEFPMHDTLSAYGVISPRLPDEDGMMQAQQAFFSKKEQNGSKNETINLYRYKTPVAQNINRTEEAMTQKRPSGLYIFAHSGEDMSDAKHLGKSYDNAVAEKLTFAKANEFLWMTGFHKFTKGYFMNVKGWTRTASLWSGGFLVCGRWSDGGSKLYLDGGYRDYRSADDGPRELFLTL